jgi:diadenosine tetraphosphate (Ap4A) HIT family hydrolase
MDCFTCRQNELIGTLPPRELVAFDEHWRVAHAFDSALPGWLVLVPRRHVVSLAELTDDEAATLGIWQVRLARALRGMTGCVKTYVMQFAEQEGFAHVHFHIVPRMPGQPADRRGPRVFGYLGVPDGERLTDDEQDDVAAGIRRNLPDFTAT